MSIGLFLLAAWARTKSRRPLMWVTAVLGIISALACLAVVYFLASFEIVW